MEGAWAGVWLPSRSADWRSWAGSGGALAVAGVSEITMPPSGAGLNTRKSKQRVAAHGGTRIESELQREDNFRHKRNCKNRDTAHSTISLRTFGVDSRFAAAFHAAHVEKKKKPGTSAFIFRNHEPLVARYNIEN